MKKLKKAKVKLLKMSPGTVKGSVVTLPVTGGSMDPTNGQGTVNQSGGMKFKAGKKSVAVNTLVLDTVKASLSGKVGGKNMKVASVSGVTFTRNGFGVNVNAAKLKLTGNAAKQLNTKLGLTGKKQKNGKKAPAPVFKGNQVLGATASTTQPSTVTVLPGTNANLVPNVATLGKFATKGVNPLTGITPIAPAALTLPGPAFAFPISGGSIAPTGTAGTITSLGGIQITKTGGATLTFSNLSIDFAARTVSADVTIAPTPGPLGHISVADLDLTGATFSADPNTRTVTVTGAVVKLQAVAAATLNTAYPGGTDFVAGDPLGTVSFTANTQ